MKRLLYFTTMLALPTTAIAQGDCWNAGFGPYGTNVDSWGLVMNRPEVTKEIMLDGPTLAKKKLIIARQEYTTKPQVRYLAADIDLDYKPTEKMSKFVPLSKGAPITIWRRYGDERQCSIGWQKGLFGGATGDGHYRWLCLEDTDDDGKYDLAWRPKGKKKRIEMPISPAVGWTDTPPEGVEVSKGGPASSYPAAREIIVRRASKKKVRIQYWGVGVARSKNYKVDLKADQPGSATMGGVTINLTPGTGKAPPTLTATGSLRPQKIRETCKKTNYKIENFETRVMFSFPSW